MLLFSIKHLQWVSHVLKILHCGIRIFDEWMQKEWEIQQEKLLTDIYIN